MSEAVGVVVAHAGLAGALVAAAEGISGIRDALHPISNEGLAPGGLVEQVEGAVNGRRAVLFTDLASGSCAFACRALAGRMPELPVVTGVNLPMLLDFLFHRDMPSGELALRVADKGRTGARVFLSGEGDGAQVVPD